MTGTIPRKEIKALERELRAAKASGIEEIEAALQILAGEAAPDPASLPTRQQRRKAARNRQKRGRS